MRLIVPILLLGVLANLSPSTVVVFILLLDTIRAKLNAIAFLIGWAISLLIVFSVSYAIGGAGLLQDPGGHAAISIAEVLFGVGLSFLGVREWRHRHQPERHPGMSKRLRTDLKELHPWQASVLGVFEQPWTLTAAAAIVVVHTHSTTLVVVIAFLVFTILSTATIGIMFLYYLRRPGDAEAHLLALRDRVVRAGPALLASVSLLVGLYLVADGVISLVGN